MLHMEAEKVRLEEDGVSDTPKTSLITDGLEDECIHHQ
jgi:hypothetical protein